MNDLYHDTRSWPSCDAVTNTASEQHPLTKVHSHRVSVSQAEANQLVEEFMLLANMSVARVISAAFPDRAVLR